MDVALWLLLLLAFFLNSSLAAPPSSSRYIIQVDEPIESLMESSLKRWHESFLPSAAEESTVDRRLLHSYSDVFSGFAAILTEEELQAVRKKKGFVRSFPDRVLHVMTTHTPDFLGLKLLEPAFYWDKGAGQVNPNKASEPGLIYDITADDYVSYICGKFGNEGAKKIGRGFVDCSKFKNLTEAELNYPSILLAPQGGETVKVRRTVTNVGPARSSYKVSVTIFDPAALATVTPETLTFTELNEQKSFDVSAKWTAGKPSPLNQFVEGKLTWTSDDGYILSVTSLLPRSGHLFGLEEEPAATFGEVHLFFITDGTNLSRAIISLFGLEEGDPATIHHLRPTLFGLEEGDPATIHHLRPTLFGLEEGEPGLHFLPSLFGLEEEELFLHLQQPLQIIAAPSPLRDSNYSPLQQLFPSPLSSILCEPSLFSSLLNEMSAVVGCFNKRAQQLLELHLASGFKKYIMWFRGKSLQSHGELMQEGKDLVAYGIINSIAMRKILKKYDKIRFSRQGQAFRSKAPIKAYILCAVMQRTRLQFEQHILFLNQNKSLKYFDLVGYSFILVWLKSISVDCR
ncbi:hypothetical protein ZIOFF_065455 [Zingiber officinale]|uniref:RING-type E3 ubiquitin transferase n=1 Tax=Zingiber officinale TaxID=94328 RepID=A0A8J5F041_ZINOF|nr:hypothetical protein ZIOFF_065455 [Zingiber officinale]